MLSIFQAPLECLGSHLEADLSWLLSAHSNKMPMCVSKRVDGSFAERWIWPLPVRPAADGYGLRQGSAISKVLRVRYTLLRPPLAASCSTATTFSAGAAAQHLPRLGHALTLSRKSRHLLEPLDCFFMQAIAAELFHVEVRRILNGQFTSSQIVAICHPCIHRIHHCTCKLALQHPAPAGH